MLFGGTLAPQTIPHTTVFRQHIYQTAGGKVVWPSVNGPIPERWPSLPAGVAGFYTLYPNPDELLAGKLDEKLQAYLAGAQPGSMLTTFAEADADASTGGQFAPLDLAQAKLRDVHARMHALCANAHVRYGSVACGYNASSLGWSARGLDFYGLDIYEPCPPGIMNALNEWRENVSAFQPDPLLCIAETNTSTPARRPFWFSAIFGWLKAYDQTGGGVPAMCTYWNPGGPLSGPWLPGDQATIEALSSIARAAP
jgi:hypothetical protein